MFVLPQTSLNLRRLRAFPQKQFITFDILPHKILCTSKTYFLTAYVATFQQRMLSKKFDAVKSYLACLHDQSKSGFFRGPAFFQLIRAF